MFDFKNMSCAFGVATVSLLGSTGCYTVRRHQEALTKSEIISEKSEDVISKVFTISYKYGNDVEAHVSGKTIKSLVKTTQQRDHYVAHRSVHLDQEVLEACVKSGIGNIICPFIAFFEAPTLVFRAWDRSRSQERESRQTVLKQEAPIASLAGYTIRFCGKVVPIVDEKVVCPADIVLQSRADDFPPEIIDPAGLRAGKTESESRRDIIAMIVAYRSGEARKIKEAERRLAEEKRKAAQEEAHKQRLEERRTRVQEAILDQKKLEARLLQLLNDAARFAAERRKAEDLQATLVPNAIKANYLLGASFKIKSDCAEVEQATDRPAFQQRRRAEIEALADQTYRRGQVINLSGACALTREGYNQDLTSPCFGAKFAFKGGTDKTDQRVLEAIEAMPRDSAFDAQVFVTSQTDFFKGICEMVGPQARMNPFCAPSKPRAFSTLGCNSQSLSLAVKILSVSNVRSKETKESVNRCVQGDCKNGLGRMDFESGDIYLGGFKNGDHDDIGAYAFKSSSAYTSGVFHRGKNHGTSLTQVSSGIVRTVYAEDLQLLAISLTEARWRKWDGSEWKEVKETDALRVPDVAESSKARFTYEGDLQDGRPEGDGILIDASGNVLYAGKWHAGSPERAVQNP